MHSPLLLIPVASLHMHRYEGALCFPLSTSARPIAISRISVLHACAGMFCIFLHHAGCATARLSLERGSGCSIAVSELIASYSCKLVPA